MAIIAEQISVGDTVYMHASLDGYDEEIDSKDIAIIKRYNDRPITVSRVVSDSDGFYCCETGEDFTWFPSEVTQLVRNSLPTSYTYPKPIPINEIGGGSRITTDQISVGDTIYMHVNLDDCDGLDDEEIAVIERYNDEPLTVSHIGTSFRDTSIVEDLRCHETGDNFTWFASEVTHVVRNTCPKPFLAASTKGVLEFLGQKEMRDKDGRG